MRFHALRAAIVRIVWRGDTERPKISSFLTRARKKSLEGIPRVLRYDQNRGSWNTPRTSMSHLFENRR
ncbi:protein of unknown function [Nitrospira defluvii]|uniref:Uncharacterized protein n=1 Tax=Nitrospira defluvii TaxID=330214 RepID=D8PCR5_9BACT|nr:protein of unknown function [Nitrospira defluvii]